MAKSAWCLDLIADMKLKCVKPAYKLKQFRQSLGRAQRHHGNPYLDWAKQIVWMRYVSFGLERHPYKYVPTGLIDQAQLTKKLTLIIKSLPK